VCLFVCLCVCVCVCLFVCVYVCICVCVCECEWLRRMILYTDTRFSYVWVGIRMHFFNLCTCLWLIVGSIQRARFFFCCARQFLFRISASNFAIYNLIRAGMFDARICVPAVFASIHSSSVHGSHFRRLYFYAACIIDRTNAVPVSLCNTGESSNH
jgi:hypothetical protein